MPTLLVFGLRNLGRAIALHHSLLGWEVAGMARSEDSLGRLQEAVPRALVLQGDVGQSADVEAAFEETTARFGTVDLVVVAISPTPGRGGFGGGSILQADADAITPYAQELVPNLFNVLRIGSRRLAEQGHGTYVQITGGSARRAMAGRGPWAAGAFATRALIQAAASELREAGVHVALLIVDATVESEKTAGRLEGRPENESTSEVDVARAVAYLAGQSPRGWTHELQITPRGDRWVP